MFDYNSENENILAIEKNFKIGKYTGNITGNGKSVTPVYQSAKQTVFQTTSDRGALIFDNILKQASQGQLANNAILWEYNGPVHPWGIYAAEIDMLVKLADGRNAFEKYICTWVTSLDANVLFIGNPLVQRVALGGQDQYGQPPTSAMPIICGSTNDGSRLQIILKNASTNSNCFLSYRVNFYRNE
jgi:hypothetical protein